MKNLVFIGFMGVGKTRIGKMAASALGLSFVDTDVVISARMGMSVSDIFTGLGEAAFRKAEMEAIRELGESQSLVIATGGGAAQFEENIINLRRNGVIICLSATPEVILERTSRNDARPLLSGDGDKLARIRELLEKRNPFYAAADCQIDTSHNNPDVTLREVLRYYREHEKSKS